MTHQEVYDFIKDVPEQLNGEDYVSDKYVKAGYGQIRGGYFDVAYVKDEIILKSEAKPSQKWHLLHSYYSTKIESNNFNMQTEANLYRIMCPQLMLWIAEIAGLKKSILESAMKSAMDYEDANKTKDSRKIKRDVLLDALYWEKITKAIKTMNTWKEVIEKVREIR